MKKLQLSTLLAVAVTVIGTGMIRAELTPNEIVNNFNSIGTYGLSFSSGGISGTNERLFTGPAGQDISGAYFNGTSTAVNTFHSFCVEPNVGSVASSGTAKLNFTGGNSTRIDSDGKAVSVGTAFLYTQFATGAFTSSLYNYTNSSQRTSDSSLLLTTLRSLMSPQGTINWTSNKFLAYLLTINSDQSYWTGVYNPAQYYDEIGNYAVFVMNIHNTSGTGQYQDFLYIAKADYGKGAVPEPATVLLWSLGSLGVFGVSQYRKRNKKA